MEKNNKTGIDKAGLVCYNASTKNREELLMKKLKQTFISLVAAIVMCLASLAGFIAPKQAIADGEEPSTVSVGVSLPDEEAFWTEIFTNLNTTYDVDIQYHTDAQEQMDNINDFISNNVDIIFAIPVDHNALQDIWDIDDDSAAEGTKLVVIGDYVSGYHPDTVFITNSYYYLGVEHATGIMSDITIDTDSPIHIYYVNDTQGSLYKKGLEDTFGDLYNVTYISVNLEEEVASSVNSWLYSNPTEEIAVIKTYSTAIAEAVIDAYIFSSSPLKYEETLLGGDTAIGVFVGRIETEDSGDNEGDSEENVNSEYQAFVAEYNEEYDAYMNGEAQIIGEAIADILSGAFNGNILNIGFAPGRNRYVTRT